MKVYLTIISLISVCFYSFLLDDRNPKDNSVIRPYPFTISSKQLNANQISTWFRNNGSFNRDPVTGNSGFEWPKDSLKFARYASGLWIGARVKNDTLVAICEYDYEFLPGYTDNSGTPQGKDDPLYRVYKIQKNSSDIDYIQWPNALLGNSNQGAPVYFDEQSHTWKPFDIGTQTMFYSYTDSYPESHGSRAGSTRPLKADIKQINFSFRAGGSLSNIAYSEFIVINRSTETWNDFYLTFWTDDDLGDAIDDKVACDSLRNLGYTYNADNDDAVYGPAPPAVGTVFVSGGKVFTNNTNDTFKYCLNNNKQILIGYKDLGMPVFNWYGGSNDPESGNPNSYYESYRYMKGLRRSGNNTINPVGNYITKLHYSGDPVTNTGWIQLSPDDQRFLTSAGPLTMNPGDTQTIVIAQVIAKGTSNLNSITQLRNTSQLAKRIYDNCFVGASNPPSPRVSYYAPGNGRIYLSWDDAAERTVIQNNVSLSQYKFQGYNIYQIRAGTSGSSTNDRVLLKTYDIRDNVKNVYDSIYVTQYNAWLYGITQRGFDNGIQRYISIDKDNILNRQLINGTPYYFAVCAYHYDSTAGPYVVSTKVIESPIYLSITSVIPQPLYQGSQVHYNFGDTILTNKKDLGVMPIVTDPLSLIDANYKSVFSSVNNLSWSLIKNSSDTLYKNQTDFSGSQDTAKSIDGFLLVHQTIPDSGVVKDSDDPARLVYNIKTNQKGWSYFPPQNQWVTGVDTSAVKNIPATTNFRGRQFESRSMGLSFPNTATYRGLKTRISANSTQFFPGAGNTTLTGGPLRKVKIIFGQQQKAYRYSPINPISKDTNFTDLPYRDFVNVPFSVFAVDDLDSSQSAPRQLNCAFIDADNDGTWNPDSTKMGKFQLVYIFASDYNSVEQSVYTTKNAGYNGGFITFDIMYVWLPKVMVRNGAPMSYTAGDVLEIEPYVLTRPDFVPGYPVSYSWTVKGTITGNNSIAQLNNEIENVKVFPNPYYGGTRLETNPDDRFIYFSNLPKACTIFIYTLSGVLIRKIIRDATDPRNSLEKWNLRNQDNNLVASGMYIAVIDNPQIGAKVLKLAVFTAQ